MVARRQGPVQAFEYFFKDVDLIRYITVGVVSVRHGSDGVISVFWLDLGFSLFWILNASKIVLRGGERCFYLKCVYKVKYFLFYE